MGKSSASLSEIDSSRCRDEENLSLGTIGRTGSGVSPVRRARYFCSAGPKRLPSSSRGRSRSWPNWNMPMLASRSISRARISVPAHSSGAARSASKLSSASATLGIPARASAIAAAGVRAAAMRAACPRRRSSAWRLAERASAPPKSLRLAPASRTRQSAAGMPTRGVYRYAASARRRRRLRSSAISRLKCLRSATMLRAVASVEPGAMPAARAGMFMSDTPLPSMSTVARPRSSGCLEYRRSKISRPRCGRWTPYQSAIRLSPCADIGAIPSRRLRRLRGSLALTCSMLLSGSASGRAG